MEPAASATLASNIYPDQTGHQGIDNDVLKKLDQIFADWNSHMQNFSAADSRGLAVFLDRAVEKFARDSSDASGIFRNIFEQAAQRLKAALPPDAPSASLQPKDQIASLAGNGPEARSVWINFCAKEGFLTQEEANDLLLELAKAFPSPPTPFEARIREIATFAMNDPAGYRRAVGRDLEQALDAQGGILASDAMKALMQKQLNSLFDDQ
ncbi:MAG: hypothetical protein LLG04_12220 [Parachlamydia sp.]|nr:hypothetical protein [Parachlamydia sp.]